MTYGVQRISFTGNTLCDKLKAEFGDRTAVAISKSESTSPAARPVSPTARPQERVHTGNSVRSTARLRAERPQSTTRAERTAHPQGARTIPSESSRYEATAQINRGVRTENASAPQIGRENARHASAPRIDRENARPSSQTGRDSARHAPRNLLRDMKLHFMQKPVTNMTPLQASVAVFGRAYRRGAWVRKRFEDERANPHRYVRRRANAGSHAKKKGLFHLVTSLIIPRKKSSVVELKLKKISFPLGTVALLAVCTIMVMIMMNSFAQLNEYRSDISSLKAEQAALDEESERLMGLLEARDDVRTVEQIATKKIGMVSSDLVNSGFVSISGSDRVEMYSAPEEEEKKGVFSTLLFAIGENLGHLSEYFN